jgi:predicted aspartyl protease
MESQRNGKMGRVAVEIEVASNVDVMLADLKMIEPEKIRRLKVPAIVDTGSTRLVLPEAVVAQLGLTPTDRTTVKYADLRRVERPVVYNVWLTLQGRRGVFSAVVEPDRADALVGAIVMEELDFLVDCGTNTVVPRDPNTTISEVE